MANWKQVIVRFTQTERNDLRSAKNDTGMTEKAILRQAFAQWNSRRKKEAAARAE